MKVSIGDWAGVESGHTDSTGVQWVFSELEGWFDGPPSRTNFTDRPQYDGAFDAPEHAGLRVITLKGRFGVDRAADRPALAAARQATQALCYHGTRLLRVTTDDEDLTALVRRSDAPTCTPVGALAFDFEVQLSAPDPIRYAPTPSRAGADLAAQQPGGLEFATGLDFGGGGLSFGNTPNPSVLYMGNAGTADVLPTFQFNRPVSLPVLSNGANGGRLEYLGDVAAGQTLTFDCKNRRVLLSGISRRNKMGRCDFESFAVPARGTLRVFFGSLTYPTSGAHVDATWQEGYW